MQIRDSSVVLAVTNAMRNPNVDCELSVAPAVAEAIDNFNSNVDVRVRHWLSLAEPRPKITVLTPVKKLSYEERDSFEAVLFSYAKWIILAGDSTNVLFAPAQDYTHDEITKYLINYMIYNGRFCNRCKAFTEYKPNKNIWACPTCGDKVGCHKGTDVGLGSVANQATADIRVKTHQKIDKLWRDNIMSRTEVYCGISNLLGIHRCYAHVGMLSAEQCEIVRKWATTLQRCGGGNGKEEDS